MGRIRREFRDYASANRYNKRMRKRGYYVTGHTKGHTIIVYSTPYRGKGSTVRTRSYGRKRRPRRAKVRT